MKVPAEIKRIELDLIPALERQAALLIADPDLDGWIERMTARLAELEQQDAAELADCLQAVIDEQIGREIVLAAAAIHNGEVAAETRRREGEWA